MSEPQTPSEETGGTPVEGNLSDEFVNLGKNLIGVLQAAWQRPERQKLQQEIEGGIKELDNVLRREAKAVVESPVTQRIKTEVGDLSTRVRSGEVETKVRSELVGALKVINSELAKVSTILSESADAGSAEAGEPGTTETQPASDTPGGEPPATEV